MAKEKIVVLGGGCAAIRPRCHPRVTPVGRRALSRARAEALLDGMGLQAPPSLFPPSFH